MYTHIHSVPIANAPFGALAALCILFICRRAAAKCYAAASCASAFAQHELGGARDRDVRREALEIILPTREAATGCRTPCPRAGSAWVASRGLARASVPRQDATVGQDGRARQGKFLLCVGTYSVPYCRNPKRIKPGHLFSRGDGGSHGRQPQPLP